MLKFLRNKNADPAQNILLSFPILANFLVGHLFAATSLLILGHIAPYSTIVRCLSHQLNPTFGRQHSETMANTPLSDAAFKHAHSLLSHLCRLGLPRFTVGQSGLEGTVDNVPVRDAMITASALLKGMATDDDTTTLAMAAQWVLQTNSLSTQGHFDQAGFPTCISCHSQLVQWADYECPTCVCNLAADASTSISLHLHYSPELATQITAALTFIATYAHVACPDRSIVINGLRASDMPPTYVTTHDVFSSPPSPGTPRAVFDVVKVGFTAPPGFTALYIVIDELGLPCAHTGIEHAPHGSGVFWLRGNGCEPSQMFEALASLRAPPGSPPKSARRSVLLTPPRTHPEKLFAAPNYLELSDAELHSLMKHPVNQSPHLIMHHVDPRYAQLRSGQIMMAAMGDVGAAAAIKALCVEPSRGTGMRYVRGAPKTIEGLRRSIVADPMTSPCAQEAALRAAAIISFIIFEAQRYSLPGYNRDVFEYLRRQYRPGAFTFDVGLFYDKSDTGQVACLHQPKGMGHWAAFFFHPLDLPREMFMSPELTDVGLATLTEVCAHEATHLLVKGHNEHFANIFTRLGAAVQSCIAQEKHVLLAYVDLFCQVTRCRQGAPSALAHADKVDSLSSVLCTEDKRAAAPPPASAAPTMAPRRSQSRACKKSRDASTQERQRKTGVMRSLKNSLQTDDSLRRSTQTSPRFIKVY